jgi:hypothetical protein
MMFLFEFKSFYQSGDTVLIEYWYNHMITPVVILGKSRKKYKISHNVEGSEIRNAPDEEILGREIISKVNPSFPDKNPYHQDHSSQDTFL